MITLRHQASLLFPCLPSAQKRAPPLLSKRRGEYLATTYSHKTYRLTTIGAAAFHFRVRNGTGWFHRALVTRGQPCSIKAESLGIKSYVFASFRLSPLSGQARSLTSTRRNHHFKR